MGLQGIFCASRPGTRRKDHRKKSALLTASAFRPLSPQRGKNRGSVTKQMLRCTSSVGLKLEWVVYAENKIDRGKEREEGEEEREKEKKVRFFFF